MQSSRRPTQHDVAKLAGVSAAVVSRVLNPDSRGTVRVGKEAEARVKRAMEQLGYVPNPVARNLATGKSHLLGVFTYEPIFPTAMRDFYFPFLVGIEQAAEERGFDLLLFTSASSDGERRSAFRDGVNRLRLADGAILLGRHPNRAEFAKLAQEDFPIVYVGRREIPGHDASYVAADYVGGTADVTTYLVELGHRRIAYLGVPDPDESAADREAGYRGTLARIGLGASVRAERLAPSELDEKVLGGLLDDGVTALLLENDVLARQLMTLATRLDLRVPERFSFAVLGDPLEPSPDDPRWTSFQIPREAMGSRSLDLLLELVDDAERTPRHQLLPCTFIPGTTTTHPRSIEPTTPDADTRTSA